jgi:hypothetical protein
MMLFASHESVRAMANTHDHTLDAAAKLKARAAHYRSLIQSIFDEALVAEVKVLVGELESEATSLERWRHRRPVNCG